MAKGYSLFVIPLFSVYLASFGFYWSLQFRKAKNLKCFKGILTSYLLCFIKGNEMCDFYIFYALLLCSLYLVLNLLLKDKKDGHHNDLHGLYHMGAKSDHRKAMISNAEKKL